MGKRCVLYALIMILLLGGCALSQEQAEHSAAFFAMDTAMTVRIYGGGEALPDEIADMAAELEKRISVTEKESEIFQINQNGGGAISPDTHRLLERALALCEETGGALDLTVYPVVRAWGFTTGNYQVPAEDVLSALLANVDYHRVVLKDGSASLPSGAALDLGSVAKGYFADCVCDDLRQNGVRSALLDLGGNIQAVGNKPDGEPWRIAIRSPQGSGYLGVVAVSDEAVVTSGGYERCFTDEDGNVWWHIIDPATGYPAKSGLLSATVVGKEGLRCDALSTALFVMGAEKAAAFWRQHKDFDMVLCGEDGELLITPSLADRFTMDEGAGLRLRVIDDAEN